MLTKYPIDFTYMLIQYFIIIETIILYSVMHCYVFQIVVLLTINTIDTTLADSVIADLYLGWVLQFCA